MARAGHAEGFTVRLIHGMPSSDIAQHFQANAAKVGIRDRNFELAFLAWAPGYPDADANAMRHVYNPDNRAEAKQTMFLSWRAGFDREWFNQAVLGARLIRNEAERAARYHEIQERFMREGPLCAKARSCTRSKATASWRRAATCRASCIMPLTGAIRPCASSSGKKANRAPG